MKKQILIGATTAAVSLGLIGMVAMAQNNDKNKGHKSVGSTLEVHIEDNGNVLVRGAQVVSVSGSTVNAKTTWGSSTINWVVLTDNSTEIIRRFGGRSNTGEVSVGDYVSFNGLLVESSSSLTARAKNLKNWSVQKQGATFTGMVVSVNSSAKTFQLRSDDRGVITVEAVASTTFTNNKGTSTPTFADINVGDKVQAEGLYNNVQKSLEASKIKIYKNKFESKRTFEGALTAVGSSTLPTAFTLRIESRTEVRVNVPTGISVVGRTYLPVAIGDFRVGDKVRVYGLFENNEIDATIVRNTSLPR